MNLHDRCPRLAQARDEHNAIVATEHQAQLRYHRKLHELQRLVDHRELQLVRAQNTGDRRYIKRRTDKLAHAQHTLRRLMNTNPED